MPIMACILEMEKNDAFERVTGAGDGTAHLLARVMGQN
jgi:hypothetical protein